MRSAAAESDLTTSACGSPWKSTMSTSLPIFLSRMKTCSASAGGVRKSERHAISRSGVRSDHERMWLAVEKHHVDHFAHLLEPDEDMLGLRRRRAEVGKACDQPQRSQI